MAEIRCSFRAMNTSDWISLVALGTSVLLGVPGVLGFLDARAIRKEAKAADKATFDRRLSIEAITSDDLLSEMLISFEAEDRSRVLEVMLDPITPGARFVGVRADGKPHTAGGLYDRLFVHLQAPASGTTFTGRCFLLSPGRERETEIEVRVFAPPDPDRAILISRRAIIPHVKETMLTK